MNKFLKVWRVLLWPLFVFAGLGRRQRKLWVFGDQRNTFTGNAKYLFTYVSQERPDIEAVWITASTTTIADIRRRGLKVYSRWSLTGLLKSLSASVYVYNHHVDDINFWTSRGATLVNLWHGTPLKVIEFDILEGPLSNIYNPSNVYTKLINLLFNPHMYVRPHLLSAPTETIAAILAKAFRVPSSLCVLAGYPRNDILLLDKDLIKVHLQAEGAHEALSLIKSLSSFSRVFIYMPTWRDDCRDFITESKLDFQHINSIMAQKNQLFLIKLHPGTKLCISIESLSNVKILDNNLDVYPLLPFTDTLITDYSSIFFDYSLMGKEMAFFPYDYETYTRRNRRMYFEYDEVTPGPRFTEASQLYSFLENKTSPSTDAYQNYFSKFIPPKPQHSCQLLCEVLMDRCGGPPLSN